MHLIPNLLMRGLSVTILNKIMEKPALIGKKWINGEGAEGRTIFFFHFGFLFFFYFFIIIIIFS